jgi:bifunctional DNA-binding transcriptional regulator/antitoxin component of YhaV-PrlF toxin-antitoxin module
MNELFRLKIASKRQITAPQRLLDALNLSEGDEIQIEVSDGQVREVHPCKAVPIALLPETLLSKIKRREDRLMQGGGLSVEEALQEAEAKTAAVGRSESRVVARQRSYRKKEMA